MLFRRKPKQPTIELPGFSFCKEVGGLAAWPASLPNVNGQTLARKLLEAGEEIHKSHCDPAQLKKIAEILRESYIKARDNLYAVEALPEHMSSLVKLKQNFFSCYGHLFTPVGNEALQNDNWDTANQMLPLGAECFSETIIASLELYRPPPPGSWAKLHDLHISLATRCPNTELVNKTNRYYLRTVSLACLQTAQLNYEIIQHLKQICENHIDDIKMLPEHSSNCTHQVVVGKDQAPEKILKQDKTGIVGDKLFIDLTALQSAAKESSCPSILAQHLTRILEAKVLEKDQRSKTREALKLCLSLESLHSQLSGTNQFEAFLNDCTVEDAAQHERLTTLVDTDIWKTVTDGSWDSPEKLEELVEFEMGAESIQPIDSADDKSQGQAMALDKSSTGYLIACEENQAVITAGSLIGIQAKSSESWALASIRWQKNEDRFNKFGVEKMAANPIPAGIKVLHSSLKTDYLPALRLSPLTEDQFLNAENYSTSSKFALPEGDNEVIIAMPNVELRDKTPALFIDRHGEKRGIIKDVIEENIHYLICLLHLTD